MPLVADNSGKIKGKFTVPANVPAGTKLVQFIGNKGNYGEATYTDIRRNETTVVLTRFDPLAQTFTLSESRHIAGVDLWFSNRGTKRVVVQIRDTSLGMPTQTVLAEGSIMPASINVNGTSTRITWQPVWLEAGHEYAIVLLTDDADAAVRVAELGKYDATHARWVTSQPYQVGVLLSSSNASTWTPHQNRDLTFRLLGARFTENTRTVDLGSVTATSISDLIALANVERVASDTDVQFTLTEQDGTEHKLSDDLPIALRARVTGPLSVKALLSGSALRSPVLYPGIQIVLGNMSETADYVTRAITAGSNSKVSITYEALMTGTADVKVYIQKADGTWQLVDLTNGKAVGDSWVERTHIISSFSATETRVKLILSGNILYRPKVRSLRVVIT
jgi:hypothetical protein